MLDNSVVSVAEKVKILGLIYPFTEDELKHAFRTGAFACHPDTGGNKEDFIKLKDAYDSLLPMCMIGELSQLEKKQSRTFEGDRLDSLGRGLPDTVNGTKCKVCFGLGHCDRYHTDYLNRRTCKRCGGSGFLRRGSRISWSGLFFGMSTCPICGGRGEESDPRRVKVTHTCSQCKGTGEIEIFNPALPKNRAPYRFKNEDRRPRKQYCSCGALMRNEKCWRCNPHQGIDSEVFVL